MKIQKPYTQTSLRDMEGNSVTMSEDTIKALQDNSAIKVDEWELQTKQDDSDMKLVEQED